MPDVPTSSQIEYNLDLIQQAEPEDLRACEMVQIVHSRRHRGAFWLIGFMTAKAQMPLGMTMGTTDHPLATVDEFQTYLDDLMIAFSRYGHTPAAEWTSYYGNPDWYMRVYHKATEDIPVS